MSDGLEVTLTRMQSRVHECPARFRVCICGRRGGKTWYDNAWLLEGAATVPGSLNWFVGPTLGDARDLFYEPMLDMIPDRLLRSKNGSRLEITLVNGARLKGLSAEAGGLRGRGVDRCVLDEFAWWPDFDTTWQSEIRPALSDKEGLALFTTTPSGYNHAYDLYMRGISGASDEWAGFQWTTVDGGQVTQAEVDAARTDMDPALFEQEYLAGFTAMSGRVYSAFDRTHNVHPVRDTGAELYIGMDFNVNPMSAVVAVKAADECHVINEIELLTSNTDEIVDVIHDMYPGRHIVVCPAPSGRARKTSAAGKTDFTILQRAGFHVRAPNRSPLVRDRINNTQAMLLNSAGRRRTLVHPDCTKLIKALDGLTYRQDTNVPDKASGLDHITDALGYLHWQEFPMHSRAATVETFRI